MQFPHPGPYRSGKNIGNAAEVRNLEARLENGISKASVAHRSWTREQCEEFARGETGQHMDSRERKLPAIGRKLNDAREFLVDFDKENANLYRLGHPLAQRVIEECKRLALADSKLEFRYSGSGKRISILEPLVEKSGLLRGVSFSVSAFEAEDHILLAGMCDDGTPLDPEQCRRFFSLVADETQSDCQPEDKALNTLKEFIAVQRNSVLADLGSKNVAFFDTELDKLDRWGEDKRNSLKVALKELDDQIKTAKKEARLAPNLPEKLKLERARRLLETKRDEAWKAYEEAAKDIEVRKDGLIDEIEKRMKQLTAEEVLFTIRWRLV